MGQVSPKQIIDWMWLIWGLNWFVSAFFVKSPKKTEPSRMRLGHIALFGSGLLLIYARGWHLGTLDQQFVSSSTAINAIAISLSALGLLLAFWARSHIGQYWSASVALKEDHRLIQTGPYRYLRHPIYTGIIFGFSGGVLVLGQYRGVLGLILIVTALIRKARSEEGLLAQSLGPAYLNYRRHTGFLLPKFN